MKSTKDFRNNQNFTAGDTVRKAVKLEPIRKSGKEKHEIFKSFNNDEEEFEDVASKKRESIFDFIGDDEEEEFDEEDEFDEDDQESEEDDEEFDEDDEEFDEDDEESEED